MFADGLTALILTFNEAPNIERTLSCLRWVPRVIVLDSYSIDETLDIARRFPNVEIHQRRFDSFASQCNFGLSLVQTPWVLSMDADYVLPPPLVEELRAVLEAPGDYAGFEIGFTYCVQGRPLRGGFYPPRTMLYRKDMAEYEQDGHAHRLALKGKKRLLVEHALHDDRKSLRRWLQSQGGYTEQEVDKLLGSPWSALAWPDRVRRLTVVAPLAAPLYYLTVRGGYRDGWAGVHYAGQRFVAEALIAMRLLERTKLS